MTELEQAKAALVEAEAKLVQRDEAVHKLKEWIDVQGQAFVNMNDGALKAMLVGSGLNQAEAARVINVWLQSMDQARAEVHGILADCDLT